MAGATYVVLRRSLNYLSFKFTIMNKLYVFPKAFE